MTRCGDRRLFIPPALFPLIFALCLLLIACGRKGDPTLKSYEKPEPPSNLHAVQRESGSTLSWEFPDKDTASIKGFHVLRSTGGDFTEIALLENKKHSFIDTDIKGVASRTYKIVAENLRGIMSKDSVTLEIPDATLPAPPADISFTIEYDVLVLSWKSAGEGITYNIYKHGSETQSQNPVNPIPLKETSFRDVFDAKKAVLYTVKSLRENGIVYEGPASREIRIDPARLVPSPPSTLQAVPSAENVYLIWKESPDTWIKGYKIYRETDRKKGFVLIGETQIPSFIDKEKPSKKRHYRVTAVGPVQESAPAEVRDIVSSK
ncbi:MAG: hypothetical protein L6290_01975 [Thermodesulfovibrionales bacterium]|nr:hypothetical protein [Thermodesulfovibrionales bacterium]